MTRRMVGVGMGVLLVVAGWVTQAQALTCMRPTAAIAWCDDGTTVWDYSSQMRSVEGPGAERGLQGYPIPSGGRADAPAMQTPTGLSFQGNPVNPTGGCVSLNGRTVCW